LAQDSSGIVVGVYWKPYHRLVGCRTRQAAEISMGPQHSALLVILHLFLVNLGSTNSLPFKHVRQAHAEEVASSNWWTRIGDKIFHEPDDSSILSQNIQDYYYAMGSKGALTDEMKQYRVGGDGRWHIFHLPKGASMLQTEQNQSDRRTSLSTLKRLEDASNLSTAFPEFVGGVGYKNPLSAAAQEIEKKTVAELTNESVKFYLEKVTSLDSRSYSDDTATQKAVDLLSKEFKSMGITTCVYSNSHDGIKVNNVIGFIPGSSSGAVIVGAHYDSRPYSGPAPGAEDNGSGIAGLLAMAKAFMSNQVKPEKDVYFVAFAAEEPGLTGSRFMAYELHDNHSAGIPAECKSGEIDAGNTKAIIMDEVGWLSPNMEATVNLETYDWANDVMEHLVHACQDHNGDALKVVHNNAPFGSDHMSFLDLGMHAVLTINGDDEAYPNYHQSSDTIENVNTEYCAAIAKMNMGALIRMAGVQDGSSLLATSAKVGHDKPRNNLRSALKQVAQHMQMAL